MYDLRKLKNYKTELEPGDKDDVLYRVRILCRRGHIFPWSDKEIGVSLDVKSRKTASRLEELGFRLVQDGDDGTTWVGPLSKLGSACRAMGARTKRKGPTREQLVKRGLIT